MYLTRLNKVERIQLNIIGSKITYYVLGIDLLSICNSVSFMNYCLI